MILDASKSWSTKINKDEKEKKRLSGRWYVPGYALTQQWLTSLMVERPAELGFLNAISKALMSKIIFLQKEIIIATAASNKLSF